MSSKTPTALAASAAATTNTSASPAPRPYFSPLPKLRIGSILRTLHGIEFHIRDVVVLVASNGGESHCVTIDRICDGEKSELLMTVGKLSNLTRGAAHKLGPGPRIDWSQAPRKPLADIEVFGRPFPSRL
jgi:hypothetical protein